MVVLAPSKTVWRGEGQSIYVVDIQRVRAVVDTPS